MEKLALHRATLLTAPQMKNIKGGHSYYCCCLGTGHS